MVQLGVGGGRNLERPSRHVLPVGGGGEEARLGQQEHVGRHQEAVKLGQEVAQGRLLHAGNCKRKGREVERASQVHHKVGRKSGGGDIGQFAVAT